MIRQFLTDVAWGGLDLLVVDTPPGTTDEHIAVMEALKGVPVDGAVLVTTPQVLKHLFFCCIFFWRARVCRPLLRLCRPFMPRF
jgi:hypothetical protein